MQDYDRTMELVNAANNSAGSSERQFQKTVESLESKLNKLKNAWDQFIRNLMNQQVIKGGIDLLTNLLIKKGYNLDLLNNIYIRI